MVALEGRRFLVAACSREEALRKEVRPTGMFSPKSPLAGAHQIAPSVRVLVVDDYEPFRRFVCSILQRRPDLQIVGEVSDGLEAVRKAEELQPDLIVLDIGLPTLNGIEAARRIHELFSECKILFVSQESSADIVQEVLRLGALGYVVKSHAESELPFAVEEVSQGRQFIGGGLSGHHFTDTTPGEAHDLISQGEVLSSLAPRRAPTTRNHEVQFYLDDAAFLVDLAWFVEAALTAGIVVIVVATESHQKGILQNLQQHGVNIAAAMEQGRYISLDAVESLSTFMESAGPDRSRFLSTFGPLIRRAHAAAGTQHNRVVVFGEMVAVLCAQGRMEAAIQLEQLWNELSETHSFHLRCAYPMTEELKGESYASICAKHSAVLPAEM